MPSCEGVVPPRGGAKALGEPCEEDEECASVPGAKAECYKTTKFVDGGSQDISYCQAIRVGKEGDSPCLQTIDGNTTFFSSSSDEKILEGFSCDVAAGLHCASSGNGPSSCKRILADGEACTFSDRCLESSTCSEGKCTPKAAVGAPCTGFGSCAKGGYCDTNTSVCAAQKADGAACEFSEECTGGSCNNGTCEKGGSLEDFGFQLICGPKK